jgi:hypothetical protein
MEKYLIEIVNGGDRASCLRSIQSYLSSRTHYFSSAEWGCLEDEHKAWLIIKTGNSADALRIIPAAYRQHARITRLHKFKGKEIDQATSDPDDQVSDTDIDQLPFHGFSGGIV